MRLPALAMTVLILGGASAARATAAGIAGDEGAGWFPTTTLYEAYLADLRLSPESMIGVMKVTDREIPDSGTARNYLKVGGIFGVYRVEATGGEWQVDLNAAFTSAQFDRTQGADNIGWDGVIGILASHVRDGGTGFRFGWIHDSSHLGDEYTERTGRARIVYTREELLAGVERFLGDRLRIYGEAGWATSLGTHEQDRLRFQAGAEFKAPGTAAWGHGGWYGALNLAFYEEKDFQVDATAQGGIYFRSDGRQWRVALTLHHGTVPIGELFEFDETYLLMALHLNP